MYSDKFKRFLKGVARHYGFVVQRYDPKSLLERCSLNGSMAVAHGVGFTPETIIDVGAARGCWSEKVSSIWPDARYILIDPLEENQHELECVCSKLKKADIRIAAITDHSGKVTINVHPDLEGSTIFLERENNINGVPREVTSITLDDLFAEMKCEHPILLKADVQGAEMQVLTSATQMLPFVEMIILEVLLFDIYQGNNPQLHDVVDYLKAKNFVVWDIFGMGYRMLDDALCQADIVFVREYGSFRKDHRFATEAQRASQLEFLKSHNYKRVRRDH